MIADISAIAPPADLDIRPVDSSNWTEHLATIAAALGMPGDLLPGIFDSALLDDETYVARNVYVDGEIAATAAVIVTDKVAGVYNVATPERFRRRGLGEAATRAVIADGVRRGCTSTTLQASEMGYPIYERMGFRTVVHWRNFVSS
jgi:ribosomal protein S18 acetylase RimI-like enzyme